MDRRVKERLIGATILVVLIVLIVPELLSGPKRPPPRRAALSLPVPTRSVSVDLSTSKATTASAAADAASAASAGDDAGAAAPSAASPTTAGPPAASADAPDAGAAAGSAPANPAGEAEAPTVTTLRAQTPAPALESHASTPKSASEARRSIAAGDAEEAAASSSHRGWAVQLGSFANKENAEKLAHQLRTQRASVYVISSGSGPTLRYRVRVGPLRDREAAEHAIAKLKSEGHPATLVVP